MKKKNRKNEPFSQYLCMLRFRYCEKAKKFEKISHIFLKLLTKVNTKWKIFQILVAWIWTLSYVQIKIETKANVAAKKLYSCNKITMTSIQISALVDFSGRGLFFHT